MESIVQVEVKDGNLFAEQLIAADRAQDEAKVHNLLLEIVNWHLGHVVVRYDDGKGEEVITIALFSLKIYPLVRTPEAHDAIEALIKVLINDDAAAKGSLLLAEHRWQNNAATIAAFAHLRSHQPASRLALS